MNNRCVYSGRSWGVNSSTGMSRFVHRTKVYQAEIPGCRRASW
jgi:ribosomal protein S14